MTEALATQQMVSASLEQVLIGGDLSKLNPNDRVMYYKAVCESVGLNPLTKPFEYISLNGKLTLYAKRDCTDQLRKLNGVSILIVSREVVEDCYVVTARATDKSGRNDESIGAVPIANLKGEARSNALMKCETKAKRRVTLSICGLGMIDETEVDSIPGAYPTPLGITPTAGALETLSSKQQEVINETASEIRALLKNDQAFDAYALSESITDADEKTALWSLLDSKQRSALKRLGDAERARDAGTITPAAHKRLEALIKESGLNREGLKDWCMLKFGKSHFTELTKIEYEELDAHIAKLMPPGAVHLDVPSAEKPPFDPHEALLIKAREFAECGTARYKEYWLHTLNEEQRLVIGEKRHTEFKKIAEAVAA